MKNNIKNSTNLIYFVFFAVLFVYFITFLLKVDLSNISYHYATFVASVIFIIAICAVAGTIKLKRNNATAGQYFVFYTFMLLVFAFTIIFVNFKSKDYTTYLSNWCEAYSNVSIKDALYRIIDVSNYTPAYNFFLLIIARLHLNYLYGIKFVTLIFSILLSVVITKTISLINKKSFNPIIFATILVFPTIMVEYSIWGQCDAIYSLFAMLAFYFALKHKSKISFLCLGLAFAFKLQFLFIAPIIFVLLIVKDKNGKNYLKWKDIWLVPLMYAINLIPALAGRSVVDLLLVYLNQSSYDNRISGNCANICFIFKILGVKSGSLIYTLLSLLQTGIAITLIILLLIIIFKYNKKHKFTLIDFAYFGFAFAFVMVFFMPKMLDRFYFLAMCLSFVLVYCKPTKENLCMFLTLNLAMILSFNGFLYGNYMLGVVSTLIGVALNIATFMILLINVKKDYISSIKQD